MMTTNNNVHNQSDIIQSIISEVLVACLSTHCLKQQTYQVHFLFCKKMRPDKPSFNTPGVGKVK